MSKFNIGDRVAVYAGQNRRVMFIRAYLSPGVVLVSDTMETSRLIYAKEKKCRRIKKSPPPREFWVVLDDSPFAAHQLFMQMPVKLGAGMKSIHVREVRKK